MPKRIPISAAKKVAQEQGLRQALLIGWDGERTHIVTYGVTKEDCATAAKAQDFWAGRIREFSFQPKATALVDAMTRIKATGHNHAEGGDGHSPGCPACIAMNALQEAK